MQSDDHIAIHRLLYTYAELVDARAFASLDRVFTADAHVDFRATGGIAGSVSEIIVFLEREMARYRRLQHFVSNVRIDSIPDDPDGAVAKSYVLAQHGYRATEEGGGGGLLFFQLGGEYRDTLRRDGIDGWRIARRELVLRWLEGDVPG